MTRSQVLTAVAATLLIAALVVVAFMLVVPWLADESRAQRESVSLVAGVVTSLATLATVALAWMTAKKGALAAKQARVAAQSARVTLGALRDASQLIAGIFGDSEREGTASTAPIPIKVTLRSRHFALVDVEIRYRDDVANTIETRSFPRLEVDEQPPIVMGKLEAHTSYGHRGEVEVECTDPDFGTRRLARFDVLATGRGTLAQRTVVGNEWLVVQAQLQGRPFELGRIE